MSQQQRVKDVHEKDKARRRAAGEPLGNEEVISNLEASQKVVKSQGDDSEITKDFLEILERSKDIVRQKNKDEEIQKIQVDLKKLAEHQGKKVGSSQDQLWMKKVQSRFDDVVSLSKAIITSSAFRRNLRRLNRLLVESLSSMTSEMAESIDTSTEGQREEKAGWTGKSTDKSNKKSTQTTSQTAGEGQTEEKAGWAGKSRDRTEQEEESQSAQTTSQTTGRTDAAMPSFGDTEHTRSNFKLVIGGKEYDFLTKDLSQENKEQIAEQLHDVIKETVADSVFRESMISLINIIREVQQEPTPVDIDEETSRTLKDIQTNMESIFNNLVEDNSFKDLQRSWKHFQQQIDRNEELKKDWKDWFDFLEQSMKNKSIAYHQRWKEHAIDSFSILRQHLESIRPAMFNLIQAIDVFLLSLKEDRVFKETSETVSKLSKDLFYDEEDNLQFKPDALIKVRDLTIPILRENFKYIALPPIADKNEDIEYAISNAVLKSEGLEPEMVTVVNSNHLSLHKTGGRYHTSVRLKVQGIVIDVQDVAVKYRKFTFPAMEDVGQLNMKIGTPERGIQFELLLSADDKEQSLFRVDYVDVTIPTLKLLDMRFQNHETLYQVFKPFIQFKLRKEIEKSVEEQLKKAVFDLRELASPKQSRGMVVQDV